MQIKLLRILFSLIVILAILNPMDSIAQKKKKKKRKKDKIENVDLSKAGQTEAEFYFIEGMRHLLLEDYDKAEKSFKKVLEIDPNNSAVYYKLADMNLSQGNTLEALPHAKKTLELDPKNESYYLILARIYEFQQDFQKASNILKRLVTELEGTEEHYFDLALIQTYLEDYEGALESYTKIQDFYGVSPEIAQQKQRLLLGLNRLDEAIKEGQALIEAFPNDEDLLYDHIKLLMSNDRKDEARKVINRLLSENPDSPEALILLSDIYRTEQKVDSANIQLRKAFKNPKLDIESKIAIISNLMRFTFDETEKESLLKLTDILVESYEDDSKAHAFRGDVLLNFQMKREALTSYKTAVELDESSLMIWINIVLIHFEFEEYDSLNANAAKALEIFPNQGRLWFMDGLGYYSKSDYKNAQVSLEKAKKYVLDNNSMRSDILSTLGDTYNSLEDYVQSDSAYEAALKINPNNEHVLNNYSYFLSLRNEDLEKAKEMCLKLMSQSPDNSTYQDTYAWVLYKLKDYDEALVYIEKAIEDSESGVVHEHYGDILYKLKRKEEAFKAWEKASEFDDHSDLLDKKLKEKKLYE